MISAWVIFGTSHTKVTSPRARVRGSRSIILCMGDISGEPVQALANGLKTNKALLELRVDSNSIGAEGGQALAGWCHAASSRSSYL